MIPWDNIPNILRRGEAGPATWFDTMQVCENGHQITSFARSQPETQKKRCPDCGAPTLMACRKCMTRIPVHQHFADGSSVYIVPVPPFCENCGKPYPWTVKMKEQGNKIAIADEHPSPVLDALLSTAEAEIREARIRESWPSIQGLLITSGNGVYGFLPDSMQRELGRRPTSEEAAKEWSRYFLAFGSKLVGIGGTGWTANLPGDSREEQCARELLRLACQSDRETELVRQLARLHALQQTQPDFHARVIACLQRCVDLLIARTREFLNPSSAEAVTTKTREKPTTDAELMTSTAMTDNSPIYTLGQLIRELEGSEQAEKENLRTADKIEATQGQTAAYAFRIQTAALVWQPDPTRHPGIRRIEALCDEEWGTGLKAENIRRLRGRVCRIRKIGTDGADNMTLDQVADALESGADATQEVPEATSPGATNPDLSEKPMTEPVGPRKVFLSHKSQDKPRVRQFCEVLKILGFEPWLDEDALHAGTELERELLKGLKDSCAAVFFITSAYRDENFLATEINYAIAEKREKKDRFSIITIVFQGKGKDKPVVPDLLKPYVWKTPKSDLEALLEIIKALPLKLPLPEWK